MPAENIELLIEFTHDDDPRARAMAVAGLAKAADVRGFAPVLVCLFDPVDEVRAAAATALGIFGDDRAFEALVECLNDPNERVAVNCAWSLGQIPTTRCLDKLCEIVANKTIAPSIRVAAATAIGERSELAGFDITTDDALIEQARIALLGALGDREGELRAACVWTLGALPRRQRDYGAVHRGTRRRLRVGRAIRHRSPCAFQGPCGARTIARAFGVR